MHFCGERHKPDFGKRSEAGKSKAILSARQHRPEGPNPIATKASRRNAAQPRLYVVVSEQILAKLQPRIALRTCNFTFARTRSNIEFVQTLPQSASRDCQNRAGD
jgi:hypothetical protein